MRLDGPVRFRFRDLEADIEVLIEGDAAWVENMRKELGISGALVELGTALPSPPCSCAYTSFSRGRTKRSLLSLQLRTTSSLTSLTSLLLVTVLLLSKR